MDGAVVMEGAQIGSYRVLHKIGKGGMGSVWLVEHEMLGRRAALKMLHPEYSSRPDIVTRFFNEARAATSISDPGIVQVFDFGHHDNGSAYIVMELLEGEPLDRRLARQGSLGLSEALRITRQTAGTMGAAHARGIVHRDLKPENLFIVRDPEVAGGERVKVLDFGIAKLACDLRATGTGTGAMMGTPMYMSPEQCRGAGQVDARSDVYALGCVLFTLLIGRPPFDAEGAGAMIAMHLREPPPVPSHLRSGIPPQIDQLVLRCLAKEPGQRFADGGELASALWSLLASTPQLGVLGPGLARSVEPISTTLSMAAGTSPSPRPAHPKLIAMFAGLGVLAIGGATSIALLDGDSDQERQASEPTSSPAPGVAGSLSSSPADWPAPVREEVLNYVSDQFVRSQREVAKLAVEQLAFKDYALWRVNTNRECPTDLVEIARFAGQSASATIDPWGSPYEMFCGKENLPPGADGFAVLSRGPDKRTGTDDDIKSWERRSPSSSDTKN